MISCVITTLKVNEYQRKSELFRINFIISCQLIKKNQIMRLRGPAYRVHSIRYYDYFYVHTVMKVVSILPFDHINA